MMSCIDIAIVVINIINIGIINELYSTNNPNDANPINIMLCDRYAMIFIMSYGILLYLSMMFFINGEIRNLQPYGIVATRMVDIVEVCTPLSASIIEKLELIPMRTIPLNIPPKNTKDSMFLLPMICGVN
jgi:hypothetical protein